MDGVSDKKGANKESRKVKYEGRARDIGRRGWMEVKGEQNSGGKWVRIRVGKKSVR